jgi:hypothetical protein
MGKTEIGDTFESLFAAKGAAFLEKHFGGDYRQIAVTGGFHSRNTPLDFEIDHSHGGELKTLNRHAQNQKTAIKAEEVARKRAAVAEKGLEPLLVVQVVDMETGTVGVYYYPDFASKRVAVMEKLGEYSFSREDFQQAQQAAGHWEKRHVRSVRAQTGSTKKIRRRDLEPARA